MLTFSWPNTRWSNNSLPGLILLSTLIHSLAFVLLQVVPKEKVTAPEREREIELLSPDVPEHQALLAAVEADSPVAALSHRLLPVEDLLSKARRPAFLQSRTPLLEPHLWKPTAGSVLAAVSSKPPAETTSTPANLPARFVFSATDRERLGTLPPLPPTPKGRLLENPVFLVGISAEGTVRHVMVQKSSGDDAADRLVENALKQLEFKGGEVETQWGIATFLWGSVSD